MPPLDNLQALMEIRERLARIEERQLLIKKEGEQIHSMVHAVDKRVHHLELFYHKISAIVAFGTVLTSVICTFFMDSLKNVFFK